MNDSLGVQGLQMHRTRHTSQKKMPPERPLGWFHPHIILKDRESQNAWRGAETTDQGGFCHQIEAMKDRAQMPALKCWNAIKAIPASDRTGAICARYETKIRRDTLISPDSSAL
ncbi:hypothetical protein [Achromobacter marplatensis]|uniref:hypothetical protein n=1 Tax=Achromobacter marplatensis TaxID=470868 RepID=UPI0039F71B93